MAWGSNPATTPDPDVHPVMEPGVGDTRVWAEWGFRSACGIPENVKRCPNGTWHEGMVGETARSMGTGVCDRKRIRHRRAPSLQARFAAGTAMFNGGLAVFHHLPPEAESDPRSSAEWSLSTVGPVG